MEQNEKYVYHVYLAKSFTKAARVLYISQPSLSAAVAAKEKELGFRIFNRSTKPITLTREGEIYVEMLEEMMRCENDMQVRLSQLNKPPCEKLLIGSTMYTSYFLLPTICGAFYRKYPRIKVTLDVGNTEGATSFYQKLDNKELDIIFSYIHDEKDYTCIPVFEERMVVAMHKSFLTSQLLPYVITRDELLSMSFSPEKEKIDARLFRDIPFLSFDKSGSAMHYMANILGHYEISNHRVINAKHSGVHFNMMCAGTGAIITSDSIIRASSLCLNDIVYFAFPREISTRKIYAKLRKNEIVKEPVKQFLDLAREIGAGDSALSLYYS